MRTIAAPTGDSVGGYRITRSLAHANGVDTFLAEDERGTRVVLKLTEATDMSSAALLRLRHEVAVLQQLEGESLTPLLAHGWHDRRLYLVASFVPGVSLADRLSTGGVLTVRDTLQVGRQVAHALQTAHDHGVLHRDVKPANIILGAATGRSMDRVVLIDFGLARSELLDREVRDQTVGSVRYMAPELAGLLRAPVDERADLYSLGLTLFEGLVGRPLFPGQTVTEVLREQMTVAPTPLRQLGVDAPRALDTILQRLLRKDPSERYQSAEGLIADLEELSQAVERGIDEPTIAIGTRDRRIALAEPAFVGRQTELAALTSNIDHARHGNGGLVLLEGESGGGKSRLLDELRSQLSDDIWILAGQGVDQAAQRPFQVLSGAVHAVIAAAEADQAVRDRLRAHLGDQREAAAVAFPELAGVLGVRPGDEVGPEEFGELRTVRALSALMDALGSAERPAAVLLDDCQWADELSVKLLATWHRTTPAAPRHVVAIAAFRTEEVSAGHTLRRTRPIGHVVLSELAPEDVRDVARSMTGGLPDRAADIVVQLAEGSPFMASAAMRGLVESGMLRTDDQHEWQLEEAALSDLHFSRRAAAFLVHRIGLLPDLARRMLTVGAVLGKDFNLDVAAQLAGLSVAAASRAARVARHRHMVWVDPSGTRCTFVHDKLRETVLSLVSDAERQDLHRRAAQLLKAADPVPVFDLAFHLDAAGDHAAALPYALAAAEQARGQQALEVAEQQYRIAERATTATDTPAALRIAEELGQVLMLRGRYDDAAVQFERALGLADDRVIEARILGQLGELAFKRGDVAESSTWLEQGLQRLGQRAPRRSSGFVVMALWEVIIQALHSLLPRVFVARRPLSSAESDLVAARIYSRLAHSYWFGRGSIPTLFVHLREMNLSERYPDTPERAQAYSEHAPVMTLLPWYRRGMAYARRSLAIRRALGDAWGEGQSLHFYGVVLYAASRFEECLDVCREAVRLLQRTGDRWEMNTARWHIAYCLYRMGDLAGAVQVAREVHASGQEIGDAQARGIGLAVWSKASGGKVPADLVAAELGDIGDDVHTGAEVLQAEARRLLSTGNPDDAVATLEAADHMVRQAGLRQEYVAPVQPWLLTALRSLREAVPLHDGRRRRRLRRQASRLARRARRTARSYRNNRPHVLREVAYLHAEAGHDRRARRLLDRSIAAATAQGAYHERAQSVYARGAIGAARGWDGAEQDEREGREFLDAAQAALAELADATPRGTTVALMDRFDVLLEAGRRIARCLEVNAVLVEVREAALALLRGDECFVIDVDGDVVGGIAAGDPGATFSRAIVSAAVADGRPTAIAEGVSEDASDSTVLSGARSILCAPISVRDRVTACLYVSHHAVGALFGEEEERLAAFLAAIAGAALENAAGFAEIQELTRTLEQRVEDRTAELRRLNQLQTDMMAVAAHDLRTPLTVLSGFAATLRARSDELDEHNRAHLLDRMVSNSKRLIDFVENLLQFARIESGDLKVDLEPFDLTALLRRTVPETMAAVNQTEFELDVEEHLPEALGDEQRQWQVLTNLLTNAAKFSPPGEAVHVAAAREGEVLRVTVRDHGPGIAEEEAQRVFEKFARLDAPKGVRRPVGTGLGLYICKSIVEAHGGIITLETRPGEGCTFSYTIPIADRGAVAATSTCE